MFKSILLAAALITFSVPAIAADRSGIKVKITAGEHVLNATFMDNATSRALIAKFPLTIPNDGPLFKGNVLSISRPLTGE